MGKNLSAIFSRDSVSPVPEISELEKTHRDEALDEALRLTFPASDPTSISFTSRFMDLLHGNSRSPQIAAIRKREDG